MSPAKSRSEGSRTRTQLRAMRRQDLPALVAFWNRAFAGRRNYRPISVEEYRSRILDCPAYDPAGLILAWQGDAPADAAHASADGTETLVGLVHAFRPPEHADHYQRWRAGHAIATLYVDPSHRNQGIGSRLLQAAENWLYYCPVDIGGQALPCYGGVEGPRAPFYGSSQHLGVSARDTELLRFLSRRGYAVNVPGDVSMTLDLAARAKAQRAARSDPSAERPAASGLRVIAISHEAPFTGRERPERVEYSLWGDNGGSPYAGLVLADGEDMLQGVISWYPLEERSRAGIFGFWLAAELRRRGLGAYLLDRALDEIADAPSPRGGYAAVEVQTHLVRHATAVQLYEARGFQVDEAWVHLVKT